MRLHLLPLAALLLLPACGEKKEAPRPDPAPPSSPPAKSEAKGGGRAEPKADTVWRPRLCADFAACRDDCEQRRPGACLRMHARARVRGGQKADAEKMAARMCDVGYSEACHVRHLQLTSDRRRSAKALTRACDLGYGLACAAVAASTRDRARAEELRQRATVSLEKHCKADDAYACSELAREARSPTGGDSPDLARARWYGDRACNLGDEQACYALADQLAAEFPTVALELLTRGCELGEARACVRLGDDSASGKLGGKDLRRAETAWQQACDSGAAEACDRLAGALTDGSLPADSARTAALKKRAQELAREVEGE